MSKVHNVIIIGSWPAWHTAAIYTGRAMLNPVMYEGFLAWGVAAGGQLTTTTDVENFPGFPTGIQGPELMQRMREQSINSGCTIHTRTVDSVDLSSQPYKVHVGDEIHHAHALIIATWATAKRLGLPWEETYWQKWISACAVCDGGLPMYRDQHLVVIGWWDSACEEAHFLTKYASKVTMLVRKDHFRASKVMQQRVLKEEKIEVLWETEAVRILGDEMMTGVEIVHGPSWEKKILEAKWLFYAIGHTPNTWFLQGQIALDETWYICTQKGSPAVLSADTQEPIPWVYAAGDVADKKYRQAITSAWTGCMAAMDVEHWLQTLTDE